MLKRVLAAILAVAAFVPATALAAPLRKVTFLLNSGFSGANSWFLLADQRGYFREAGLDVTFIDGRGAFTAAGRVAREGYDFGYGDMQAVVEEVSADKVRAPVAIYMLMDHSPSVIALPAASKAAHPGDLRGLTITGHTTDVSRNTFAQYAGKAGIDQASINNVANDGDWKTLLGLLEGGGTDALFGYSSTIATAVRASGREPDAVVRFFRFVDVVPELYGSTLMAAPALVKKNPALVRAFVKAANRGVMAAVCDPDAALAALAARSPSSNLAVERKRLADTVNDDMGGRAALAAGVGGIDDARLDKVLTLTATGRKLARRPAIGEVFSTAFLPPLAERQAKVGTAACKGL